MARSGSNLVAALLRTREVLERMIARLEAEGGLSASDEQTLRRGRRAVRRINNEYLPWARMPNLPPERAADIGVWLNRTWGTLLEHESEGG